MNSVLLGVSETLPGPSGPGDGEADRCRQRIKKRVERLTVGAMFTALGPARVLTDHGVILLLWPTDGHILGGDEASGTSPIRELTLSI
jgi:hypothetical protein